MDLLGISFYRSNKTKIEREGSDHAVAAGRKKGLDHSDNTCPSRKISLNKCKNNQCKKNVH